MSLALVVAKPEKAASLQSGVVYCHKLGYQLSFAEKILISRRQLQLLSLAAKQRQEENELLQAVIECQTLLDQMLDSSLENARKKVRSFAIDLLTGKESYRTESIRRRIISQREIHIILTMASLQISETWEIPVEPVLKALLGAADIDASSPGETAKMIAQYKTTAILSETVYQAVQIACEKSMDAISPHWIVKEAIEDVNIAAAMLKAVNCYPEDEQRRCIADIEKCIDGMLTSVYVQLKQRCTKQLTYIMYLLYQPAYRLPSRRLYLVSKAM